MQKITWLFFALLACFLCRANDEDSLTARLNQYNKLVDSVNKVMKYETGLVTLSNGIVQLAVPQGFKYLNADQSHYVLTELWGNPLQPDIIGMLFPDNGGPFADSTYAFVITYKAMGYVKDADAGQLNYDQKLKDMQKEEVEENAKRKKMGYPPIHIVGWAQKPYYDKENKVLHWAKELQFGGSDVRTLNYDIVILGRKGILSMNAVGNMSQLDLIKKDLHKVLQIAAFSAGNRHEDFDPKLDEVATWTIGSLVAGKVLAKAGVLAFVGKFLKLILIALAAALAGMLRLFKRKKPSAQLGSIALLVGLWLFSGTAFAQAPPLSANAILQEATARAVKENKKVFVLFHASWCGWCHRMDSLMNNASCKQLFDNHFVIRHLVVMESGKNKHLENPGGMELLTKYHGKDKGIPFWVVLDAKGKLVADCMMRPDQVALDQPGENTGCPATKEEVAHFVKVLKQTTTLNDQQLAIIEKTFIKE